MAIEIRTKNPVDYSQNQDKKMVGILLFLVKKYYQINSYTNTLNVPFETYLITEEEREVTEFNDKQELISKLIKEEVRTKIDYHIKGGNNSEDKVNGLALKLNKLKKPEGIENRPIENLNYLIANASIIVIAKRDKNIKASNLEIASY